MSGASYFLGIDGGQSATVAMIGDSDGRIIGTGRAGPCNHVSGAELRAKFTDAVSQAIDMARQQAGLRSTQFEAACLGFSGGAADKAALVPEVLSANHVRVTHDADIALLGALAGKPGVIVIAGTGSIAHGRNADGREARAGGWGYVFGDEGSAFDIVRQALRAALRAEEGWGRPTALAHVLAEASGAASMNDLLHRAYTPEFPRQRVASWAPLIDEAARNGDSIAADILRTAARQLALLAASAHRQLFQGPAPVSYTGGVFASEIVVEAFQSLAALNATMEVTPARHGPAAGALLGAYALVGAVPELTHAPGVADYSLKQGTPASHG